MYALVGALLASALADAAPPLPRRAWSHKEGAGGPPVTASGAVPRLALADVTPDGGPTRAGQGVGSRPTASTPLPWTPLVKFERGQKTAPLAAYAAGGSLPPVLRDLVPLLASAPPVENAPVSAPGSRGRIRGFVAYGRKRPSITLDPPPLLSPRSWRTRWCPLCWQWGKELTRSRILGA